MSQGEQAFEAARSEDDRRTFLKKAGVAGAAAWTAPVLLSQAAAAQGTPPIVPPSFVTGSTATGWHGPDIADKAITLTSGSAANPLQAGDLFVAILAYHVSGTIVSPGAGWTVVGPNSTGDGGIYSVATLFVARLLTAADLSSGVFSHTFQATGADLTWGGFRGAASVYRGTNLQVAVTSATGNGPTASGDIVTATFPATTATPPTPNVIVRLGAGRGYGGCNATSGNNDWRTWPGTGRVDFSSDNEGDRPLVISDQTDGSGASATGTWYRQAQIAILCQHGSRWSTYTAAITNGP